MTFFDAVALQVYYPSPVEGRVLPGFGFGIGWFGYLVLGYSPRNVSFCRNVVNKIPSA